VTIIYKTPDQYVLSLTIVSAAIFFTPYAFAKEDDVVHCHLHSSILWQLPARSLYCGSKQIRAACPM